MRLVRRAGCVGDDAVIEQQDGECQKKHQLADKTARRMATQENACNQGPDRGEQAGLDDRIGDDFQYVGLVQHCADGSLAGSPDPAINDLARRAMALWLGGEPNCHAGLQSFGAALRIEAEPEGIEVMVADGAGRAPGREFPQRTQFRHASIDPAPVLRRQRHRFAERHFVQIVFTQRESEPGLTIHCPSSSPAFPGR